jgi:hypothetical protein
VSTRGISLAAAWVLALAGSLQAQVLVNLDFETAGAFSNNFRFTFNSANSTTAQSSNGASNDYVTTTSGAVTDNEIFVYDTTPADGTVKSTFSGAVSIEADIRAASTGSSFGFFIINPASEGSSVHYLALFNWDVTGSNDRMRLFTGNPINSTTVGTSAYDSGATSTVNSGLDVGGSFGHMTLTYRADTTTPTRAVFNLTVGTMTTGDILLGAGTYLSSGFEVGIRSFDSNSGAGSTDFDNFSITQVPEPSTAGLLLLSAAVAGLACKMRRRT